MKKIFGFVAVAGLLATTACGGGNGADEKAADEAIDSIAAVDSVEEPQEPEAPAGLLITKDGIGNLSMKTPVKDYPEKVEGLYDKLTYKVEENEMDGDMYYYEGTLDGKKSARFIVESKGSKPCSMSAMKGTNVLVELDGKQVSPWQVTAHDLIGLGGKPVYEWGSVPFVQVGKILFCFEDTDLVESARYKNETGEKVTKSDFKATATPSEVNINTWTK
ncbi:MAG: hypothetical protein LUC85_07345 [Bacteroidales bacterium]|nr:hypothetical protein [Bacteroidales bacterium]MCD8394635.1 hypothetical protein [Bacteroidales bacterium]